MCGTPYLSHRMSAFCSAVRRDVTATRTITRATASAEMVRSFIRCPLGAGLYAPAASPHKTFASRAVFLRRVAAGGATRPLDSRVRLSLRHQPAEDLMSRTRDARHSRRNFLKTAAGVSAGAML